VVRSSRTVSSGSGGKGQRLRGIAARRYHSRLVRTISWCLLAFLVGAASVDAAPQWQALPGAPMAIRIDDLHFLDASHGWVATGDGGIYRTTNGGASWDLQLEDQAVYFRCIRFADSQRGFAGTLNSAELMYRTTNGGLNWTLATNIPEPTPNALCGMSIGSSQVIYGVGSYSGPARMIKSTDGGATWTSKDLAPLANTLVDVYFTSATNGLAVGSIGSFPYQSRAVVLQTADGGNTWQQRYLGNRLEEWGWKISFPTPTMGYVSLERLNSGPMFLLKTQDGGATWAELPFVDENEQGVGFATTTIGWIGGANNPTYGTVDGGTTWTPTPWGDYLNRFQFLSPNLGYGSGVTIYKYSDALVSVGDGPKPKLEPLAAPNPFASRTTINFSLETAEQVRLFVADPAGRLVRTLEDGVLDAGPHVVTWDGRNDRGVEAPAGIYLYVLHAGARHDMGKLVRVR
jgi:photosystem II stability/assembly factor-like uncharacterized protein